MSRLAPGGTESSPSGWGTVTLAALASIVLSVPLMVRGTPDVESYTMSIFSTMAFVRNLAAGVDPWFVPGYGFGIPLPTSTWLIKFPPAIPAALLGVDALYAAVWIFGEFAFGLYLLKLTALITRRRSIAVVVLVTGLLSFSNLGTTYVDDWPEHFLGWALFPAALWHVIRTLCADSRRERVRQGALCAVVLGVFVGSTHQNEIVTFSSGMALVLCLLVWTRPGGVLTVGAALCVALTSAMDVLMPTLQGMWAGGVNPLVRPIAVVPDDLSLASYGIFLEPGRVMLAGGVSHILGAHYQRVPFFGLVGLVLAVIGAIRLVGGRAGASALPKDVTRAIGVGFVAYSTLTLMPAWVALGLPRMWMYRDGQTLFALLCGAAAMDWIHQRHPRLLRSAMILQLAQVALVAAPLVRNVILPRDTPPLFGYARHERLLFDGIRQAGVDGDSRVILAGRLEPLIRGGMPDSGVTAGTDFPLDGLALVNAWYRGAGTPALGPPSMDGRYGSFETTISWGGELKRLTPAGLDVLGISHVLALEDDPEPADWIAGQSLTLVTTLELPAGRHVQVFRNEHAWAPAVFLSGNQGLAVPPLRPECPGTTVFCRDYEALSQRLWTPLQTVWHGASAAITLPPGHAGGTLFVSVVMGPAATATVDGRPRVVEPFLDTFGTIEVLPADRVVMLSVARPDRRMLTLVGLALLAGCLGVALIPSRVVRQSSRR